MMEKNKSVKNSIMKYRNLKSEKKEDDEIKKTPIELKSSRNSRKRSSKKMLTIPNIMNKSHRSNSGSRGFSTGITSIAKTSKVVVPKNVSVTIDDTDDGKVYQKYSKSL